MNFISRERVPAESGLPSTSLPHVVGMATTGLMNAVSDVTSLCFRSDTKDLLAKDANDLRLCRDQLNRILKQFPEAE